MSAPENSELRSEELENERGEALPDREAMSLIDPSLGPPVLDDPYPPVDEGAGHTDPVVDRADV